MNGVSRMHTDTRSKILEAATRLFAEKGYQGTTVAMVCSEAGANIAAVNYHFGSKEKLYQQAWRYAHDRLKEMAPPDGGVDPGRPPEERLKGRIRAALQRAMMGDAIEFRIMQREMANPTGLLREVIDEAIRPVRMETQKIIRELLGSGASDLDVELCEVCVVAPWIHMTRCRKAEKYKGLAPVFREDMLDELVEKFTAYALAGIGGVRNSKT